MSVRLGAVRIATVLFLLAGVGGAAAVAAAPAFADEDRVRMGLPSGFIAGGSPGAVTIAVSKRTDGCVALRTALAIRLPGLTPDLVAVETRAGDDWVPVVVSDSGDGLLVTGRTAPDRDELCERKSRAARYQVTFLAGAPAGTANLVAQAYTAGGDLLGRAAGASKVGGRLAGTYAPAPPSPGPSPTGEPSTAASAAASAAASGRGAVAGAGAAVPEPGGGIGMGAAVMTVGVGMVGVGVALLVLLLRRGRDGRDDAGGDGGHPGGGGPPYGPGPDGGGGATMVLPRVPR